MKTQIIIWVASLVLIGTLNVVAEEMPDPADVSKRTNIKRLMEVTDASNLSMQIMNRLILTMQEGRSDAHKKFWADYMAEVNPNDLIEMIIPIYEKHFTHEEIKQLIAFYESPIGKKMLKVQPQIMMESIAAGEEWGKQLVQRAMEKLREEGYHK
ncbi:MAG: DUF2059 domain-containing protein [Gemmatimonadetes bacterium]|nr:DUF2059 domain-containing protein [Gemmatimonadota bacterium]